MRSGRLTFAAFALILLTWLPLGFMARGGLAGKNTRSPDGVILQQSGVQLAFGDPRLGDALKVSVVVAFLAGLLTTLIVAINICALRLAAACLASRSVSYPLVSAISVGALVIPDLALGVGIALLLAWLGVGRSLVSLVYAHTLLGCLVGMPVALTLTDRVSLAMEMAAMDTGCGKIQAAWRITVPSHRQLFMAVFLLSSILSFEDFVLALFVAPSGVTTLPLYVYSLIKFRRIEEANALGLLLTLFALVVSFWLSRIGRAEVHDSTSPRRRSL